MHIYPYIHNSILKLYPHICLQLRSKYGQRSPHSKFHSSFSTQVVKYVNQTPSCSVIQEGICFRKIAQQPASAPHSLGITGSPRDLPCSWKDESSLCLGLAPSRLRRWSWGRLPSHFKLPAWTLQSVFLKNCDPETY